MVGALALQPLNVGIQRLLKLSIKRSAHRDIVEEALGQIQAGKSASEIKLNITVGILRDRSVGWIVEAIHDLSDPEIIKKAFEMCRSGDYNFSQASLMSPEVLERDRFDLCAALQLACDTSDMPTV
ncbi:hypothetical protein B0H10DRAFT_2226217 [Mycena sp. CBHHK59/15]|nr:hypothetical protein B0H10DRAFT_2226217 [Mycena sp. CBHHK59/15]